MTWKPHQRNNFLAGLFLVTALALAVVVSVILSGNPFTQTRRYQTRFSLSDGATGLDTGSPVLVGGHEVGQVVAVRLDLGSGDDGVVVTFETERDVQLHADAWVTLERPLLGSLSALNIPSIGSGEPADAGTVLTGSIAPPSFLRDAGWRDEERTKLQRMMQRLDEASARAIEVMETVDPARIDNALGDVEDALTDIRETVAQAKEAWPGWSEKIDATLASAEAFSGALPGMAEKTEAGIDESREVVSKVNDRIDRNSPRIDDIIDDVHATADRVNEEWGPLGTETLTSARDAMTKVESGVSELTELLAEHAPEIRKIFANGRLASDQLKLAILEIRAQPWRLLVKPTTREFESQVLYDAARTYAMAVSDLRATSEMLASLEGSGAVDEARLARLRGDLDKAFEQFHTAESQLLDRMIEDSR